MLRWERRKEGSSASILIVDYCTCHSYEKIEEGLVKSFKILCW